MKIISFLVASAAAIAVAGCKTTTTEQQQAVPGSAEQAALVDAGIDAAGAQARAKRVGTDNLVDTGLAVGMTHEFGGVGLAAGILGVLSSPGKGMAGYPNVIINLPPNADKTAYETRFAQSLYRSIGRDLEAEGYTKRTIAKAPDLLSYVKDNCGLNRDGYFQKSCSKSFNVNIYKPTGSGTGNAYVVSLGASDRSMIRDYETIAKRVVDMHPNELSLYLPPRRVSGEMTGPFLYRNGQETPI